MDTTLNNKDSQNAKNDDDTARPRDQPQWKRQPARKRKFPRGVTTRDKRSHNDNDGSSTVSSVQGANPPASVERVRALQTFLPIFISTSFLKDLVHLVCERIKVTDPRLAMEERHLFYATSLLTFERILSCDALFGNVYVDTHDLRMYLSGLVLPAPLADYVESIGPYRLMSGINVVPSLAHFLPDIVSAEVELDNDTYVGRNTWLPMSMDAENRATSTLWTIVPEFLAMYRMCTSRLMKKTPCRPISSTLAGTSSMICSTRSTGSSREVFICEDALITGVKKACIFNFNDRDAIHQWPKINRRLLYPYFTGGCYDTYAVLSTYEATNRE